MFVFGGIYHDSTCKPDILMTRGKGEVFVFGGIS